jgi:chaperonin cofactor prefoldin
LSLIETNFEHTVTKLKENIENLKKQVTAVEIENKNISENLKDVTGK